MNNSISNKIQTSISARQIQMEKYRSEKHKMNNSIYKYWVIIGTKDKSSNKNKYGCKDFGLLYWTSWNVWCSSSKIILVKSYWQILMKTLHELKGMNICKKKVWKKLETGYKVSPKIQRHIGSTKRVSINTGLTC